MDTRLQLARARQHAERRMRLGYPDAKAKLREIKAAEERALRGEPEPGKPRTFYRLPLKPKTSRRREVLSEAEKANG